jgi:hypothetical protein
VGLPSCLARGPGFRSAAQVAFCEASSDDASIVTSFDLASEQPLDQPEGSIVEQAEMPDEYLLTCCPTVPGFSIKDNLWSKILPF